MDTDDEKSSDGMLATVAETQRTVMCEIAAAKKIFRVLLVCFYSIMSHRRKDKQRNQKNFTTWWYQADRFVRIWKGYSQKARYKASFIPPLGIERMRARTAQCTNEMVKAIIRMLTIKSTIRLKESHSVYFSIGKNRYLCAL